MKTKDKKAALVAKTRDELVAEEARLRREIFDLQFKAATQPNRNTAAAKTARRDLARVLTAITARDLQQK